MDDIAQRLKKLEDFAFGRRRAGVELTDDSGGLGVGRQFALDDHYHAHGNRGGGKLHAVATIAANGFMSTTQVATLAELVAEVAALTPVSHPALTLGAFSSTPTAQGLALDVPTQVLQLAAADGTHPGGLSTTTQTIGGAKTFSALITASLGVTSGAATLPLYSSLGASASDVCIKRGTTASAGSVNSSAQLDWLGVGIGGTEAPRRITFADGKVRSYCAATVGNSVLHEWYAGAGRVAFLATSPAYPTSATLYLGNGGGIGDNSNQRLYLDPVVGSVVVVGRAAVSSASVAVISKSDRTQPDDSRLHSFVNYLTEKSAVRGNGEYENFVSGGGIVLKSPIGTRYRTQNTDPGGITVTNIATATVTTSVIGTNTGDITLAAFGTTPNANGLTLTGQVLNMEPASISRPGGVSTVAQVFSGVKTMHVEGNNTTLATLSSNEFQIESSKGAPQVPVLKLISFTTPVAQFYSSTTGAAAVEGLLSLALVAGGTTALTAASTGNVTITGSVTASNLSGTNTGDVTIGAFSATPSSLGATLTAPQIINLTAADATNPGGVSINAQTFGGVKTADGWTGTNANTSTTIGALTAQLRAVATGASGIPVLELVGNGVTRGIIFGGTTGNFGYNAVGGSHVFFNNGTSIAAITPTEARPATAGGLDLGTSSLQWNNAYLTAISLKGTINGTAGTSATADNAAGRNVLSSGSTTYTITNSLVTTNSMIFVTVNSTGQATSSTVRAVPAAGSFTVVFSSAVTANTTFSWCILDAF